MIETNRLILRRYLPTDFNDFFQIYSNPKVMDAYGSCTYNFEESARYKLEEFIRYKSRFAIVLKSKNKVVGEIALCKPVCFNPFEVSETTREMGVAMNEDFQKQGIMTEAGRGLIKYCFEKTSVEGIFTMAFPTNIPSLKFSKKCGLKVLKNEEKMFGLFCKKEIVTSAITLEDYKKSEMYQNLDVKFLDEESKKSENLLTNRLEVVKMRG